MDDTWFSRDLPVLDAVVQAFDGSLGSTYPNGGEIASKLDMKPDDVGRALMALDGRYLNLRPSGDPRSYLIMSITPTARQAVGQWPSAEVLTERLAAALNDAADRTTDPEKKGKFRQASSFIGGAAKDITVETLAALISRQMGGA